ncbi:DUF732 domain-containing protein [Nocardioides mesophilus]|uniref:DUF732 domain-containing protein n=1 Tax=Nocardioides mesophilus TaxID=433659 RepID=A0A7G9R7G3_9ACTN|nr:DUF732 domain-containing protein [Nocardioides mesophilus]QNN51538.1 DUF732 domain-containing protein [Nocardioides mesophilus]
MRRLALVLAAALLAGGCSGTGEQAPSSDQGADRGSDRQFLDALVQSGVMQPQADDAARRQAVREGREWCAKLTDPATTREDVARALAKLLRDSDTRFAQRATAFYGTAAQTYCPEAAARLQG